MGSLANNPCDLWQKPAKRVLQIVYTAGTVTAVTAPTKYTVWVL